MMIKQLTKDYSLVKLESGYGVMLMSWNHVVGGTFDTPEEAIIDFEDWQDSRERELVS